MSANRAGSRNFPHSAQPQTASPGDRYRVAMSKAKDALSAGDTLAARLALRSAINIALAAGHVLAAGKARKALDAARAAALPAHIGPGASR